MNVVEMVMARAFCELGPEHRRWLVTTSSRRLRRRRQELIERKAETIENIAAKLAKAEEDNAPASVIDAYNKLLLEATGRELSSDMGMSSRAKRGGMLFFYACVRSDE